MTDQIIYAEPENPALPKPGFVLDLENTPRSSSRVRRLTSSAPTVRRGRWSATASPRTAPSLTSATCWTRRSWRESPSWCRRTTSIRPTSSGGSAIRSNLSWARSACSVARALYTTEGIILLDFAPLEHAIEPRLLDDPHIVSLAQRCGKTPAQVLLAWGTQRGTAVLTSTVRAARISENFDVTALPESAIQEINEFETRYRFNSVVETGIPGFIEVPRVG